MQTTNDITQLSTLEMFEQLEKNFLANINHEIRTPIHGASCNSSFLLDSWEESTNEEKKVYAERIYSSIKRLTSLIDNLLDYNSLKSGIPSLKFDTHNIKNLLEDIIKEYQSCDSEEKDLGFRIEIEERINLDIHCDKSAITQAVQNIYNNAIRYAGEGPVVTKVRQYQLEIKPKKNIEGVLLSFSDKGIGAPQSELENIFLPFYQNSRTYKGDGGVGLGLTIAEKIITAHQGKIWAKNNSSEGISFFIFIPYKQN